MQFVYEAVVVDSFAMPLVWYWVDNYSVSLSGNADAEYVSQGSYSDIIVRVECDESQTKHHDASGGITVDNGLSAIYSFYDKPTRGGRGAYTKRKVVPQHHIFIYDVYPDRENGVCVSGETQCEFIKVEKFTFLKQLPKLIIDAHIDDSFVTHSTETDYVNFSNMLHSEDEDMICFIMSNIQEDAVIVTTNFRQHAFNDDDEMLEILGFL